MKINLTKEEIENFTCDVCGKKLDIFYYQNHWREIKGVCKQCDSMDDSYEFRNVICESCWQKAFPNIKENSKSAKIVAKMNYLEEIGELYGL